MRQERAKPLVDALEQYGKLSRKAAATTAIQYALGLWPALVSYCGAGRMEVGNSAAERALRAVAIGKENYL